MPALFPLFLRRILFVYSKPYKFINGRGVLNTRCLLCFDSIFDSFNELPSLTNKWARGILDVDIEFTEELFEFSAYEKEVINAYDNLDFIDVSFKLLNNDNEDINSLIDDEKKTYVVTERKHEYPLEKIRIRFYDNILKILYKAEKKNIDYLCFSDNYNTFVKLTKDKQQELKKYIKDINKK